MVDGVDETVEAPGVEVSKFNDPEEGNPGVP
jgi:hypothetical protein